MARIEQFDVQNLLLSLNQASAANATTTSSRAAGAPSTSPGGNDDAHTWSSSLQDARNQADPASANRIAAKTEPHASGEKSLSADNATQNQSSDSAPANGEANAKTVGATTLPGQTGAMSNASATGTATAPAEGPSSQGLVKTLLAGKLSAASTSGLSTLLGVTENAGVAVSASPALSAEISGSAAKLRQPLPLTAPGSTVASDAAATVTSLKAQVLSEIKVAQVLSDGAQIKPSAHEKTAANPNGPSGPVALEPAQREAAVKAYRFTMSLQDESTTHTLVRETADGSDPKLNHAAQAKRPVVQPTTNTQQANTAAVSANEANTAEEKPVAAPAIADGANLAGKVATNLRGETLGVQPVASPSVDSVSATAPPPGVDMAAKIDRLQSLVDLTGRQMLRQIGKGGGTIRLQLDPPELGKMHLTIHVDKDVVRAEALVETVQVRQVLIEHVAQLRQVLEDKGLHLEQFEVFQQMSQGERNGFGQGRHASADSSSVLDRETLNQVIDQAARPNVSYRLRALAGNINIRA